jgi:hypothetical protein
MQGVEHIGVEVETWLFARAVTRLDAALCAHRLFPLPQGGENSESESSKVTGNVLLNLD